jgi:ribosomal protein S18 acetylase RimI-like enzyme
MEMILDNPIWHALSTHHLNFNEGDDRLKYFYPEISPFVAMADWDEANKEYLAAHLPADRNFFYITAQSPDLPDRCKRGFAIKLFQLVCRKHLPFHPAGITIRPLGIADIPQMIELTALTKPGPFNQRTIEFGNYIGVFDGKRLAAMAGERLRFPGYTEVSAICTHPDYSGRRYSAALLSQATARIVSEGQTPFLHVRHDNTRAIDLYEQAGYEIRCEMDFAIFKKPSAG